MKKITKGVLNILYLSFGLKIQKCVETKQEKNIII